MSGNESWQEGFRKRLSGTILFDERADRHTSLGVGGRIDALAFPESVADLTQGVAFLRERRIPFLPVGNWTNLIVRGGGYRGALLSLAGLHGLNQSDGDDGSVCLEAEAGLPLAELVSVSVREALTGAEFCAGIPGSVGGAVRMNAGAYGGEIEDICTSIRLLNPEEGILTVARDSLSFSYRNLDLPAETIIICAAFHLRRGEGDNIAGRVREIITLRREKHPLEYRNAGSIFKNPKAVPAGRLIEEAGLKGMRIGDAQVSEKHGNFIVNRGVATAEEIISLIEKIQKRVFEMTGYALETEVRIIGE
ncbi:MAG: UDP-N-acetylmuramate dehydrogenase [Syntrophales bacterium]